MSGTNQLARGWRRRLVGSEPKTFSVEGIGWECRAARFRVGPQRAPVDPRSSHPARGQSRKRRLRTAVWQREVSGRLSACHTGEEPVIVATIEKALENAGELCGRACANGESLRHLPAADLTRIGKLSNKERAALWLREEFSHALRVGAQSIGRPRR